MTKDDILQTVARIAPQLPKNDHIMRIALFGSQLHNTQNKNSDVDLLIEFKGVVTLFDMGSMQKMLEESLGMKVDLVTANSLSKYFRDDVLAEAQTLYEQA